RWRAVSSAAICRAEAEPAAQNDQIADTSRWIVIPSLAIFDQWMYAWDQYCPVNLKGVGQKANSGAAFRVTRRVSDLNGKQPFALAFRVSPPRSRHVRRQ